MSNPLDKYVKECTKIKYIAIPGKINALVIVINENVKDLNCAVSM